MIIYLDFDGTVVEHEYPKIGRCNFGCIEIIKKLQDSGHEIILNTYRADCANGTLEKAIKFLNEDSWAFLKDKSEEIELKPVLVHTLSKVFPQSWDWNIMKMTDTIFIDDIAAGIPLKPQCMVPGNMGDWDQLDLEFQANGIY